MFGRLTLGSASAAIVAGICALCPGVAAAKGSGYFVTFVARSCPSYQDVFANKARNDIQESLDDLGPDSPYNNTPGLVDPSVEEGAPQDACSPLPGWEFTLGHGYETRAVSGPWGSLSKVTDPFPRAPITTQDSTPLYDQYHNRVKGQSIAGAVTVELTSDERTQAGTASQLWAQGGTPDDPVLAQKFPGPTYGFAALRCATDAVNGDNVEYIFFPAGVTHEFCYAFYVVPPPTSGTITIQKQVVGAPAGETPAFAFNGSISFNPDGFTLADGQSLDFFRAGGQTWEVTEGAVDHYTLTSVDCTAKTASGGAGSSTATVTGATTDIHLVAAEHVTCVYTNTYEPPTGGLTIDKITRGGVGRFGYTVAPAGGGSDHHLTATTRDPGVPAYASPELTDLAPGRYTVTEAPPATDTGRWRSVRVVCDGVTGKPGSPVQVTVRSGETSSCEFVDAFVPAGAISLAKITTGSTGSVAFVVSARNGHARQFHQHATTTEQGVAADAAPDRPTDATDHLSLGRYLIAEQAAASEDPANWVLESVACNGQLIPFDRGVIAVTLTPAHPRLHCVFTDRFVAHPPPTPPPNPPPTPNPPPGPPAPDGGNTPAYAGTDLTLAKQALTPAVARGQAVTFRITVHNKGPATAANVVVADQPKDPARIISVRPSVGQCQVGKVIICRLGNLKPGATAAVMVRLIPETSGATFTNRAVVGGTTAEATLANNIGHATIRVLHPPTHPIACSSALEPVARAAC
ncbi:MAG TPA: DUF11 domain-containing protein [Solirubrobacteraceae bacterium]|nr:DUF11 domain-containing protein [Solirubrobacteraceae bacterium]